MSNIKDDKLITFRKETNQKAKHKEFKYFNQNEEKKEVLVSQFELNEELKIENKKERIKTDKQLALNILLSNITIGEVI